MSTKIIMNKNVKTFLKKTTFFYIFNGINYVNLKNLTFKTVKFKEKVIIKKHLAKKTALKIELKQEVYRPGKNTKFI